MSLIALTVFAAYIGDHPSSTLAPPVGDEAAVAARLFPVEVSRSRRLVASEDWESASTTTTTVHLTPTSEKIRSSSRLFAGKPAYHDIQGARRPPAPHTTPTAAPAAPVPAGACIGRMQPPQAHACWDRLINQYAWPHAKAFAVMYCESTGDPNNTGPQTRYGRGHGLMQVMNGPYDPDANMALAFQMWKKSGWGPWSCA